MNPDVVDLEIRPEDAECGRRVFVRPSERYHPGSPKHTKIQDRERTWITAEDKLTQRLLRAEIFTDRIARFEVLTTNRDLRKEDVEVIGIQAYDTESNVFSTLDGLEFIWTVQAEPPNGRDASNLLQLLPIKGSHVDTSQIVLDMEANGKQSSFVVAQAKSTGKVVISARLVDLSAAVTSGAPGTTPDTASPQAQMSHSVVLSILEPLNLVPASMIHVAPYATLKYLLQTIERDSFRNISMPNPDYVWSTTNSEIATVDNSGIVSTHGVLGSSFIDVSFTAVDDNHAHGHITVVEPRTLDLTLNPLRSFSIGATSVRATSTYIIGNELYQLEPSLYDHNGNRLYTTENVKFKWQLDAAYFDETPGSLVVYPKQLGATSISVSVESIGRGKNEQWQLQNKLEHTEEIVIVSPLAVKPHYERIVLPYHPLHRHSLNLVASGGSGMVLWTTDNRNVASVNANGVLSGLVPGNDTVRCVDARLAYNKVEIPVIVAVPKQVGFVQGAREAEIDSKLILGILLTGQSPDGQSVSFHNCSALPMSANLTNQEVFGIPSSVPCPADLSLKGACACIQLQALRTGQSSIQLFFDTYDLPAEGQEGLGERRRVAAIDSTLISAFRPVKVSHPQVLLSHSASLDIAISGGPAAWQTDAQLVPQFHIPHPNQLSIDSVGVAVAGLWKYRIQCKEYGEQYIRISVGNTPSLTNPEPVTYHQSLKYACLAPHSLILHPHDRAFVRSGGEGAQDLLVAHLNARTSVCADDPFFVRFAEPNATLPSVLLSDQYKLRVGTAPIFNLTVLDQQGRRFDNFSSLAVEWRLAGSSVQFAAPLSGQDMKRDRRLVVADELGSATITVAITGYDESAQKSSGFFSSSSLPALPVAGLTRTYDISIVKNVAFDPALLSLYHQQDNRVPLALLHGSGDAHIRSNGTRLVAASVDPGVSSVFVQPVKMGVARLTAIDSCLVASQPAHALVRVSDVHAIRIIAPSILQLGQECDIQIQMLDAAGHPFDKSQLKWSDLKLHLEGDAIADITETGAFTGASTASADAGSESTSGASSTTGSAAASAKGRARRIQPIAHLVAEGQAIRAFGAQLGISTLSISMTNAVTGVLISSTPVQIQVFSPLQVYPNVLELLPGATFQLETFGGPPTRSRLSFASSNHSLISVTSDGVVTSKNLLGMGEIVVTAHVPASTAGIYAAYAPNSVNDAVEGNGELVWSQTVQVIVKHLHGILIHSSTTRLIVGEEIVVRIIGLEHETPFIWSGIDLAFQWEAVNPDILGLGAIHEAAGISYEEEQGQAIVVKALVPGTTRLSARLVAGPTFLSGKSASLSFEVVPALALSEHRASHSRASSNAMASSSSSYSNGGSKPCLKMSSQRLLLAPHTRHSVRANLASVDYASISTNLLSASGAPDPREPIHAGSQSFAATHIQSDSVVILDTSTDLITSKGVAGSSVLQLQDKRDGQQLLVHLAVKPIHHVELRARSPAFWDMPVGSVFDFDIVLRDNLGQPFDSYEWTQFTWHFCRHDIVHAEVLPSPESQYRRIFRVKGVRPGTTMVQFAAKQNYFDPSYHSNNVLPGAQSSINAYADAMFDKSPYQFPTAMQHFHTIRVANAILPLAPVVHLGGVIHFNISLSASQGGTGPTGRDSKSFVASGASGASGASAQPNSAGSSHSSANVGGSGSTKPHAWSSSKPNVLRIDALTGVATALAPGKATIYYNTTVFTSTVVRSVEVATVEMDAKSCKSFSNIEGFNTTCSVPLTFIDLEGRELVDLDGVRHHISGYCYSEQSQIIEATFIASSPDHDGRPVCQYVASKNSEIEDLVTRVTLSAAASDRKQTYKTTNSVFVSFLSAFVVHERSVRLLPSRPSAKITILSNEPLIATSRDPSRVNVELLSQHSNTWTYSLSVPPTVHPFSGSYVDFVNNITRQTEFIAVSYDPTDDGDFNDISSDSFFTLWTAVGLGTLTVGIAYIIGVVCG
jgi:hypothetical protein